MGDVETGLASDAGPLTSPEESGLPDFGDTFSRPSIPTDATAIVRRKKSLSTAGPIGELNRTKIYLAGDYWEHYDLESIALALIDQVALHMGISTGMYYSAAVDYAQSQARSQRPQAASKEHHEVGLRVVTALIGTEPFTERYVEQGPSGPIWRVYSFRLLEEALASDGDTYLRATQEAINVLVGGLDVDVESAQIATEAQIRALIERGALDQAAEAAKIARLLTVKYLEKIRTIERDTLVDLESHDWLGEVPAALTDALSHVCGRIEAETALYSALSDRRDTLVDPSARRNVNLLLEVLADCQHNNSVLQEHLIGVRGRMRAVQDSKFERRGSATPRHALDTDLLAPLLDSPAGRSSDAADVIWRHFTGVRRSIWLAWPALLESLLSPVEQVEHGEALDEPEFTSMELPEWWEAYWDVAESLLNEVKSPTRLDSILARIEPIEVDGTWLEVASIAAALCHQAYSLRSTALVGDVGESCTALLAIPTGEALDSQYVRGPDLLLLPVVVAGEQEDNVAARQDIPEGALL